MEAKTKSGINLSKIYNVPFSLFFTPEFTMIYATPLRNSKYAPTLMALVMLLILPMFMLRHKKKGARKEGEEDVGK